MNWIEQQAMPIQALFFLDVQGIHSEKTPVLIPLRVD
jgi:hypothetical protein